jgi:hypothetical protein
VNDLIEKLYANPALHTFHIPIEMELHAGMVIELNKEIGTKYNVEIQQHCH